MATEITVPHVAPIRHGPDRPQDQRAEPQIADAAGKPQAPGPSPINPSLKFDPAAGLVIMEFKDTTGEVSSTIPSQRQIDAYRRGAQAPGIDGAQAPGTGGA